MPHSPDPAAPDDATAGDSRGRSRRRAWRLYSWGSRAHWVSTLFASRADVAVSLAALGLIGGVAGTTLTQSVIRSDRGATIATAQPQRAGDNAVVFGIEGRDEAGLSGAFDLVVLDKRFDWVRGSTSEIVKDGAVLSEGAIAAAVLTPEVRQSLARAKEVIAVGTASAEGDIVAEIHRAGLRAKQTADWIAPAVPAAVPLHTLNLGQYRDACATCETADTSWQRPFIIVTVRDKDAGVDIAQALAAAMSDKSNLPSLSAYSTFGFARHR